MLVNFYRYLLTVFNIPLLLQHLGNHFKVVSSRKFKGKVDAFGKEVLPPGVVFTLMVMEDHSEPVIDKETNQPQDNNEMQTFDVTVLGLDYPSQFKRGDEVSLGKFDEENSFYINYTPVMRFREIRPYKSEEKRS